MGAAVMPVLCPECPAVSQDPAQPSEQLLLAHPFSLTAQNAFPIFLTAGKPLICSAAPA